MTSKRQPHRRSLSLAKLDEMIEEATVDAYGESEQIVGFFTMLGKATLAIMPLRWNADGWPEATVNDVKSIRSVDPATK